MSKQHERQQCVDVVPVEKVSEPVRGFVSAPTGEQLKPTEREAFLLETLLRWGETSEKSRIVLGQPLSS
jgi:hypothetical protein